MYYFYMIITILLITGCGKYSPEKMDKMNVNSIQHKLSEAKGIGYGVDRFAAIENAIQDAGLRAFGSLDLSSDSLFKVPKIYCNTYKIIEENQDTTGMWEVLIKAKIKKE